MRVIDGIHKLCLSLTFLTLTSCATIGSLSKIEPVSSRFYDPQLNTKAYAEVGTSLYSSGVIYTYKQGIRIKNESIGSPGFGPNTWKLSKGIYYAAAHSNTHILYFGTQEGGGLSARNSPKGLFYPIVGGLAVNKSDPNDFDIQNGGPVFLAGLKLSPKPIFESIQNIEIATPDSFKREILYNGKQGNVIFMSYREFQGNMARPAFTQNLTFEMVDDSDNFIGTKGLRIKVLDYSNTGIWYEVASPFEGD